MMITQRLLKQRRLHIQCAAIPGQKVAATMPGGERFCLFDTKAANGCYVELMELSAAMQSSLALMEKAHLMWDGVTDPVRGMERLAELAVD